MGFQDSAYSVRSRLHVGELKPRVIIGILLVAAVMLTCLVFGIVTATSHHSFEVRTAADDAVAAQDGSDGAAAPEAGESEEAPSLLCVHVSGCVVAPGVFYVEEGARVADAVQAAGGLSDDAAPDAVNLARIINDGEHIVVPSVEQAAAAQETGSGLPGGGAAASAQGVVAGTGLVNINTADVAQLQTLDGIGEATAAKIIKDREANGPFQSIEDIKRVSGIGDKKFDNIKDSICVG